MDRKNVGLLADDTRRSRADIGGKVSFSPSAVNEYRCVESDKPYSQD